MNKNKRRKELIKRRNVRRNESKLKPILLIPSKNIDLNVTMTISNRLTTMKRDKECRAAYEIAKKIVKYDVKRAIKLSFIEPVSDYNMIFRRVLYNIEDYLYDDSLYPDHYIMCILGDIEGGYGRRIIVEIASLDRMKTDQGTIYHSNNTVNLNNNEYPLYYSRHALDRLYKRLYDNKNSISLLVANYEFDDDCVIKTKNAYLFPHFHHYEDLLMGYFVGNIYGDKVVMQTFIMPGMGGTPEEFKINDELSGIIRDNESKGERYKMKFIDDVNEYVDKSNKPNKPNNKDNKRKYFDVSGLISPEKIDQFKLRITG